MTIKALIYEFLKNHAIDNPISFHMPGHKGGDIYKKFGYGDFIENIMKYDITEIHGADYLFHANSIIEQTQKKYAKLYNVKKSFILVNGATSGILASVLTCVKKGEKIIMARNSHKSVFNALVLGDIYPIYIQPEIIDDYHISGEIHPREVEKAFKAHPDAKAIILPSPNYYGIGSDIKTIVEIAHQYNKVVIVDEAHGAHLHFSDRLPECAICQGADIVINSTHKTLASFTQSAVLHVNSEHIDIDVLKDKLQMIQSSSPSYILMASMDINADIMEKHGKQLVEEWVDNVNAFYTKIKTVKNIRIINDIKNFDKTKINIDMTNIGLIGKKAEKILREEYNIFMELVTTNIVMGMTGIGSTKKHLNYLAHALLEIENKYKSNTKIKLPHIQYEDNQQILKPTQAVQNKKIWVDLEKSVGKVCSTAVIPYPPGIPLIYPGEIFTERIISEIKRTKGDISILGLKDGKKVAVI